MKVVLTRGCIHDSLTVDGTEEVQLTDEQRHQIIDKIADWLHTRPDLVNNLLQDLVDEHGTMEWDYTCECCHDTVTTTTWVIPE